MTTVAFLPLYQVEGPSSRYRVFQFLKPLQERGIQCTVLEAPQNSAPKRLRYLPRLFSILPRHDVVYIQKRFFPRWVLATMRRINPRIIFDIDDAVHLNPRHGPQVGQHLEAAAHVVVGNEYLADYARLHNRRVTIIPSVVDTDTYRPFDGVHHPGDDRVIIGWIGTNANRGDFRILRPTLDALHDEFGDTVALRIVSDRPLDIDTKLRVEFVRWSLEGSLFDLQQFDVGIMPLEDSDWNRGKCGFKLIQYLAVGVPAVASPVGVNEQIVKNGSTGLMAGDSNAWFSGLSQLIRDEGLRRTMGQCGRAHIDSNYSLKAILPRLVDVIEATAAAK